VTVTPYGALCAAGLAVGTWVAFVGTSRRGLEAVATAKVLWIAYLATLLATKASDWFLSPDAFSVRGFELANGWSGLGFPAGLAMTALIERAVLGRAGDVVDSVALGMSPGIVLGRVACRFAGCCDGVPIESATWRRVVRSVLGDGVVDHPAPLYNVLAFLAATPLVLAVHRRGRRGEATAVFLLIFGVTRFAFGFVRTGFPPAFAELNWDQVVAVGTIAASLSLWLAVRHRTRDGDLLSPAPSSPAAPPAAAAQT
jgi:prolipoprotein diacylglyceryltransferase